MPSTAPPTCPLFKPLPLSFQPGHALTFTWRPYQADVGAGRRLDAFTVFVEPLLRKGANITVCPCSFVTKVLFEEGTVPRATAVEVETEQGSRCVIRGGEIVLASGAALSGPIFTISTVLSWICAGIYMCGVLPSPVLA